MVAIWGLFLLSGCGGSKQKTTIDKEKSQIQKVEKKLSRYQRRQVESSEKLINSTLEEYSEELVLIQESHKNNYKGVDTALREIILKKSISLSTPFFDYASKLSNRITALTNKAVKLKRAKIKNDFAVRMEATSIILGLVLKGVTSWKEFREEARHVAEMNQTYFVYSY